MYGNLKPYTFFWYTLFQYLATCQPEIHPHSENIQDIQLHIEKRLMPEATKEEIEMNIIDIVDKNSGSHVAGWFDSIHNVTTSVQDMIFNLNVSIESVRLRFGELGYNSIIMSAVGTW